MKIDKQRRDYFNQQVILKDQCNEIDKRLSDHTEVADRDFAFLKDEVNKLDANVKHTDSYLHKALPVKTFSSTCNLLHQTLGSHSKGMLNNLVLAEKTIY